MGPPRSFQQLFLHKFPSCLLRRHRQTLKPSPTVSRVRASAHKSWSSLASYPIRTSSSDFVFARLHIRVLPTSETAMARPTLSLALAICVLAVATASAAPSRRFLLQASPVPLTSPAPSNTVTAGSEVDQNATNAAANKTQPSSPAPAEGGAAGAAGGAGDANATTANTTSANAAPAAALTYATFQEAITAANSSTAGLTTLMAAVEAAGALVHVERSGGQLLACAHGQHSSWCASWHCLADACLTNLPTPPCSLVVPFPRFDIHVERHDRDHDPGTDGRCIRGGRCGGACTQDRVRSVRRIAAGTTCVVSRVLLRHTPTGSWHSLLQDPRI